MHDFLFLGALDWAAYIALALAAASAGTGIAASQKSTKEANARANEEFLRQRNIQKESSTRFAESLAGSKKGVADEQLQQGEQQRLAGYEQAQGVPIAGADNSRIVGGGNPVLNLQDMAQRMSSNQNRAKLGAYDKWQLDQLVKNTRASQEMAMLGQQAQQSQAILPLELNDAAQAGDGLRGVSAILGALGAVAGGVSALGGAASTGANAGTGASVAANTGTGATTATMAQAVNAPGNYGWLNAVVNGAKAGTTATPFLSTAAPLLSTAAPLFSMYRK